MSEILPSCKDKENSFPLNKVYNSNKDLTAIRKLDATQDKYLQAVWEFLHNSHHFLHEFPVLYLWLPERLGYT